MKQKELKEAFLAGWEARDNLFKPANERWNTLRDEALAAFYEKQESKGTLKGIHE